MVIVVDCWVQEPSLAERRNHISDQHLPKCQRETYASILDKQEWKIEESETDLNDSTSDPMMQPIVPT